MKKMILAALFAALGGLILATADPNEFDVIGPQYQGYTKTYFQLQSASDAKKWDTNSSAMNANCTFAHAAIDLTADTAFKKFYGNIPATLPTGIYTVPIFGSADATADYGDLLISCNWGQWNKSRRKWTWFDPQYGPASQKKTLSIILDITGKIKILATAGQLSDPINIQFGSAVELTAWDNINKVFSATPAWADTLISVVYNPYTGSYNLNQPTKANGSAWDIGQVWMKVFGTENTDPNEITDAVQYYWSGSRVIEGSFRHL